ncbi:MAG: hypothetical protein WC824_02925, partial [Bacteroidota bacterium]
MINFRMIPRIGVLCVTLGCIAWISCSRDYDYPRSAFAGISLGERYAEDRYVDSILWYDSLKTVETVHGVLFVYSSQTQNKLFLTTGNGGLWEFNRRDGTVIPCIAGIRDPDRLVHDFVEDPVSGYVFIATEDGVYRRGQSD